MRTQKIIRDFPPLLKNAIAEQAVVEGTSMNAVVVGILADAFNVRVEYVGKPSGIVGESTTFGFDLPRKLRSKINVEAARRETTATDLIIAALEESFGLEAAA